MRKAALFLSRFLLSLWLVLVSAFLFLLLSNAPYMSGIPFASVSINAGRNSTIYSPNRLFTCTETEQQFNCQAEIQAHTLKLSLTKKGNDQDEIGNCYAWYNGRVVDCWEMEESLTITSRKIYKITGLELSSQQLRVVRQKYWGINILRELGEVSLLSIGAGISLVGGISVAFFTWFHLGLLSKIFASFACGFAVTYAVVWGLLGSVPYSVVSSYGFTPDTWNWIVDKAVITAIVGTTLTNSLLFWRRCNRLTHILISISISVGIFYLCRLSISWNFDYLASFLDFLQDETLIISLSTVISVIFAIIAVILLWLNTNQSIKIFLCLSNGFGAIGLSTFFFLDLLLSLGYAD